MELTIFEELCTAFSIIAKWLSNLSYYQQNLVDKWTLACVPDFKQITVKRIEGVYILETTGIKYVR